MACPAIRATCSCERQREQPDLCLPACLAQCDLKALVSKVDEVYENWRTDTLVLFGGSDSYIPQQSAFDFLETKRTCIKIQTFEAKVRPPPHLRSLARPAAVASSRHASPSFANARRSRVLAALQGLPGR